MEASRYWVEWSDEHRARKKAGWKYGPTGKPSGGDQGDGDGDGKGGGGGGDGKGEGEDGTGDDKREGKDRTGEDGEGFWDMAMSHTDPKDKPQHNKGPRQQWGAFKQQGGKKESERQTWRSSPSELKRVV